MFPGFNDRRSAINLITDHRLLIPGIERPACFIRSSRRHCGQALPTVHRRQLALPEMPGERTTRSFTAARSARIDLLFTMSDNLRAIGARPSKTTAESALIDFLTNEFLRGLLKPAENGCQSHVWQSQTGSNVWWSQTGSNRRPPACKAGALPTELWPRAS